MTDKIDVLAIMESDANDARALRLANFDGYATALQRREQSATAHAAVAELIEKVDTYVNGGHMEQFNEMVDALAAVQSVSRA